MENITELYDSHLITDILNKAFMTVALQFNFTKETVERFPAFMESAVIDNQLKNSLKMYGYSIDNKIVGCVGYSFFNDRIYMIERLGTLPEYRHKGIGKKLMVFIENKIRENGGEIAEIHVIDINEILVKWYKNMNYKQIRIDKLYDGERKLPFNSCVMNKELNKMIVEKNTKIGINNFTVELHDHQIEWEQNAKETIEYFKNIFGDLIIDVEHIGSTSIKSIKAKPIIDLVVGIKDFNNLDIIMEKMKSNGLTYCPKRDGPESKMFVIGDLNGILTHIIHLVEYNGNEWNNKINFRDYMNNNIEKAKEYEKVKIKSMENNTDNVPNYHKSKEQFVIEKIKEANNWKKDHDFIVETLV